MTTIPPCPTSPRPSPLSGSLIAGFGAFLALVGAARAETPFGPVAVTVTETACDPAELKVPAGLVTFQISNGSKRALEWEILKGVAIIDERENIAPGFRQKLTTRLDPGEYEITCGLLDNPRGRLIALNAAGTTAAVPTRPTAVELVGPVAEYRVWVAGRLDDVTTSVTALAAALTGADRPAARARLIEAKAAVAALAPAARLASAATSALIADLDGLTPVLAGDAPIDAAVAARLVGEADAFRKATRALSPSPADLLAATSATVAAFAEAPDADGAVARARIDGVAEILRRFAPLATRADAAAGTALGSAVDGLVGALPDAAAPDRDALARAASTLVATQKTLPALLGL